MKRIELKKKEKKTDRKMPDAVLKMLSPEAKDAVDAMTMVSTVRGKSVQYTLPIFQYVRCENA